MPIRIIGNSNSIAVVGITSNGTDTLPAGFAMLQIYVRNNTANTVTGGLKIGTSNGGTEVVTALAVGANALTQISPTISGFSATNTTLFIQAVGAWNNANLDIVITMDRAIP